MGWVRGWGFYVLVSRLVGGLVMCGRVLEYRTIDRDYLRGARDMVCAEPPPPLPFNSCGIIYGVLTVS